MFARVETLEVCGDSRLSFDLPDTVDDRSNYNMTQGYDKK